MPATLSTVTINEEGDRSHRALIQLPDTAPTARFFGGAIVFGTGSDDEGTMPAIFNQLNPNLRVLNHGESSFLSRQGLARLINLISENQKSDLVVFYDGLNDIGILCKEGMPLDGHHRGREIANRIKQSESLLFTLNGIFLKFSTRLITYVKNRTLEASSLDYSCSTDPKRAQNVAEVLVNNWKIAHSLVTQRGGRFIAILQPIAYMGHAQTVHVAHHMKSSALKGNYNVVYPIISRMMEKYSYMHDLTSAFDGEEFIYIDYGHVSRIGNAIIANKITEILREN